MSIKHKNKKMSFEKQLLNIFSSYCFSNNKYFSKNKNQQKINLFLLILLGWDQNQ